MLQSWFYFLSFYADCWNKNKGNLKQRKNGESLDVTFYTKEILIEFTNNLHSNIQLMHSESNFLFSRNSSDPLEHKFGMSRVRCKNIRTLTRFIQIIAESQAISCEQTYQQLCFLNDNIEDIRGRVFIHNSIVNITDKNAEDEFPYTPQKVAMAFLNIAGFEIEDLEKDIDCLEIVSWCAFFLSDFINSEADKKRKTPITFNTKNYGVDNCQKSKEMIMGLPFKGPVIPQGKSRQLKESSFLKFFNKKFGNAPLSKSILKQILQVIIKNDKNLTDHPSPKEKKQILYNWIVENFDSYYILLQSYDFDKE